MVEQSGRQMLLTVCLLQDSAFLVCENCSKTNTFLVSVEFEYHYI